MCLRVYESVTWPLLMHVFCLKFVFKGVRSSAFEYQLTKWQENAVLAKSHFHEQRCSEEHDAVTHWSNNTFFLCQRAKERVGVGK